MNIALDAFEAGFEPPTGTGQYVRHLVAALLQTDNSNTYHIFHKRSHGVPTAEARSHPLSCPANRTLWSQVRLPLHLLRNRYDLLHVPGHKLPAFCPCKSVVTIHDLAFMKFPETFKSFHRQRLVWFTRNAVRRADRIIAVSESTKRDLCELLGADELRVDTVHHGVDHDVFRPNVTPAQRTAAYVLSVGTLQPRKNYVMLIRAFNRLCESRCKHTELLIAGQRGWMYEEIEAEAKKSPYADRIHLLGYVADDLLPSLYAGAALVAMPSLYEGFGLPLLEAMACGASVIASNASSFPEVAGEAAMLLDPDEPEAWAEAMHELLGDEEKRRALRQKAIERAKLFSWERTAQATLDVYRKTAAR